MPNKIYVYVCDYDADEGKPIYAVAESLEEIPEDTEDPVGVYLLNNTGILHVTRRLK